MTNSANIFMTFRLRVVSYFRKRRLERFREIFPESMCRVILDMGGTSFIWKLMGYRANVTLLNLQHIEDV